jgi:dihydroxyacetone kinase
MNFRLAAEDAADEGIRVEVVVIDDDVAVQDSTYTAGRRGVGATVLAEKIAGAAAERGDDVEAVAGLARRVNEQGRSFGIALSSCTPPGAAGPLFDLPDGEMEVGIGIHGEPEVHDVAGVVLAEMDDAGTGVDGHRGRVDLHGHRRGEHGSGTGGVEHAAADEAGVQRFMP